MDTLETKQLEMIIRVCEDRQEFALVCPEGSYGAELFDRLAEVAELLGSSAYEQSRGQSSVRESSGSVAETRAVLLRRLEAIHRTVGVLAFTRPDLEDKFRSPHGVSDTELLTLARTYGNDAFPLKAELIKRKLSPDFINELSEAALAFDAARKERTKGRDRRITATGEIDQHLERGMQTVRELDVMVRNTYDGDPAKLALWESASHVVKPAARRSRKKGNGNPPPAPPKD